MVLLLRVLFAVCLRGARVGGRRSGRIEDDDDDFAKLAVPLTLIALHIVWCHKDPLNSGQDVFAKRMRSHALHIV